MYLLCILYYILTYRVNIIHTNSYTNCIYSIL